MNIEFDAAKDASNRKKHGLYLADAARLDLTQVTIVPDQRRDYGEARFQAYGRIDGRLHVLTYTLRPGAIRAISFRKRKNAMAAAVEQDDLEAVDDIDNPELTEADFARGVPFSEAHPVLFKSWKRQGGRPTLNEVPKVHVGFRLAADVVNHLKASGKGYGARVESVLRDAIARGVL